MDSMIKIIVFDNGKIAVSIGQAVTAIEAERIETVIDKWVNGTTRGIGFRSNDIVVEFQKWRGPSITTNSLLKLLGARA